MLLRKNLSKFHKVVVPLEDILIPNDKLAVHPLMQESFLRKGMRAKEAKKGLPQFEKLYKQMAREFPDDGWDWPPNFDDFGTSKFWGMPEGRCFQACSLLAL